MSEFFARHIDCIITSGQVILLCVYVEHKCSCSFNANYNENAEIEYTYVRNSTITIAMKSVWYLSNIASVHFKIIDSKIFDSINRSQNVYKNAYIFHTFRMSKRRYSHKK